MFVTDFLSRNPDNDIDSPNEIIPIAFLLKDATEEWDDRKPFVEKKMKIVNAHNCYKCLPSENHRTDGNTDSLFVMTRSMAKAGGAAVPQMYPLQGDHKRPEVSKTGMIQAKAPNQQEVPVPVIVQKKALQGIQELQVPQEVQNVNPVNLNQMVRNVNTIQTVNTNFPNINPAHTVYPQPIQPAQPIPKPSFQEERDTRANQENLNLPASLTSTKGVIPIPLNVKLSW